jgi:oligopeptide/dipeptide ABC transporter ATP-binding protein
MSAPILSIEDLHVRFNTYAGTVHAVNGITFDIYPGEMLGLVGESGCGKSVTGLAAMRMVDRPGRIVNGRVLFHGEDIMQKSAEEMRTIRGGRIAMIFQNPGASLNPVFTLGNQTTRLIRLHTGANKAQARERALAMYTAVGLPNPDRILGAYPHNLSGGMQQRAMIAMALACDAELLIADEPTTALDVTVQAQILALLAQLRQTQGLSILLITHDLGIVAETCDRVAVAYAGRIVETGRTADVLYQPHHPYTRGLLAALPDAATAGDQTLQVIKGNVPDGLNPVPGCPFHPRCPEAMDICQTNMPPRLAVGEPGHLVNCFLYNEVTP